MKSLAFGEILWDIIKGKAYIGGAPFNLAAHMSKMGMDSFIISSLGKDKLGIEACELLDKFDIRKNYISVLVKHSTGTVDVVLDEAGIPDYVINENTAWDNIELTEEAINSIISEKWDVFCFGTLAQRTENNKNLLKKILNSIEPAHVFYDVNIRQNYYDFDCIDFSLKKSTIVKINDDEAVLLSEMIFNRKMSEEVFAFALSEKYKLDMVCITRGGNGAAVLCNGKFSEIKGLDVKVADTVGAGDSFSAGLLTAYLNGTEPKRAVELANEIGAYVAANNGAIPEYSEELKGEIRKYFYEYN